MPRMAAAAIEMKVRYDIGFLSKVSHIITTWFARNLSKIAHTPTFTGSNSLAVYFDDESGRRSAAKLLAHER
jgi:hypothetical protein